MQYREKNKLKSREDLKSVPALSTGSGYEHAAGFLRVTESEEKLDSTFIHPNFYAAAKGVTAGDAASEEALSSSIGKSNAKHVLFELAHAGEDPRGSYQHFEYDLETKSISDLKREHAYPGVVTNVTSFGAFVDIGIEQDGLVHISELTDVLAKNPFDALFPGDPVTVWVANVNDEKKQISLTMKEPGSRGAGRGRGATRGDRAAGGGRARRPRGTPREGQAEPQPQLNADGTPKLNADGTPMMTEPRAPRGRGRGPRREQRPREGAPPEGGYVAKDHIGDGQRKPREPREGEGGREGGRGPREGGGRGGPREGGREGRGGADREPRKAKKPMRDTKTGAIVKMDENEKAGRGGPKMPTKAKPMAFNPFANLGDMLKKRE